MLDRIRTQMQIGPHPNRALQADRNARGPEALSVEIPDLLPPEDGADSGTAEGRRMLEVRRPEEPGLSAEARY